MTTLELEEPASCASVSELPASSRSAIVQAEKRYRLFISGKFLREKMPGGIGNYRKLEIEKLRAWGFQFLSFFYFQFLQNSLVIVNEGKDRKVTFAVAFDGEIKFPAFSLR